MGVGYDFRANFWKAFVEKMPSAEVLNGDVQLEAYRNNLEKASMYFAAGFQVPRPKDAQLLAAFEDFLPFYPWEDRVVRKSDVQLAFERSAHGEPFRDLLKRGQTGGINAYWTHFFKRFSPRWVNTYPALLQTDTLPNVEKSPRKRRTSAPRTKLAHQSSMPDIEYLAIEQQNTGSYASSSKPTTPAMPPFPDSLAGPDPASVPFMESRLATNQFCKLQDTPMLPQSSTQPAPPLLEDLFQMFLPTESGSLALPHFVFPQGESNEGCTNLGPPSLTGVPDVDGNGRDSRPLPSLGGSSRPYDLSRFLHPEPHPSNLGASMSMIASPSLPNLPSSILDPADPCGAQQSHTHGPDLGPSYDPALAVTFATLEELFNPHSLQPGPDTAAVGFEQSQARNDSFSNGAHFLGQFDDADEDGSGFY
ncbi:hypothetical protein CC85DRAFT_285542 [Cutaneotrichosporon oleaginosum]|uniref:Uncharacterized protein n=1 Tax=Cutaneotrichosporon oleaginosum TaxID=879819 RepID=A0A0J1B488_9TREE|nr:uncharacterized protein CC85DRAFT_285542 [Cutaneotrichosporon oleaginosum]KLT42459.1 hypothetical protein CC85DRAFT_285542 [Cutaneotrichosporon oleaginosum]TXT06978.1 hypothetical protein COLE_06309 [Cutaneotrichosporon oleaginosum]